MLAKVISVMPIALIHQDSNAMIAPRPIANAVTKSSHSPMMPAGVLRL
jgi:hypothetical protein